MYVEVDILNFLPIIWKKNDYPWRENICGDDCSMVLLYENKLDNTIISGNSYLSGNIIL